MFGRRFDGEGTAARAPFFSSRLFGKHVTGACDWSRAHTETGPMADIEKSKFSLAPHPIERENNKRKLEPTADWHANAVKNKREILKHANGKVFQQVLKETEAKELIERIGDEVDEEYIHDFRNWIAGIGKRSDYVKGGVPLASVGQGKPLSNNKEVINFIDRLTGRVIDYYAEIANMKMRGPGVAAHGGPSKLKDLWNYFKYVIRNEPINPEDFAYYREPVDDALVGNQDGIVDEPREAPSLTVEKKGEHHTAEESRLRRRPVDSQSRKKNTPKAQAKDVSGVVAPEVAASKGPSLAVVADDPMDGGVPKPPDEDAAKRHAEQEAKEKAHAEQLAQAEATNKAHEAAVKAAQEKQAASEAKTKAHEAALSQANVDLASAKSQGQMMLGQLQQSEEQKQRVAAAEKHINELTSAGQSLYAEYTKNKSELDEYKEHLSRSAQSYKELHEKSTTAYNELHTQANAEIGARDRAIAEERQARGQMQMHLQGLQKQLETANANIVHADEAGKASAEQARAVLMGQMQQALEAERIRMQNQAMELLEKQRIDHAAQMQALLDSARREHEAAMASRPAAAPKALRGRDKGKEKSKKTRFSDVEFSEAPPIEEAHPQHDDSLPLPGENEEGAAEATREDYDHLRPDYGEKKNGLLSRMSKMGLADKFRKSLQSGEFPSIDSGHEMREAVKFMHKTPAKRLKLLDKMGIPPEKQRAVQWAMLRSNPTVDREASADEQASSEIDVVRDAMQKHGRRILPSEAQGEIRKIGQYLSQREGGVFRRIAGSPKGDAIIQDVAQILFHTFGAAVYQGAKPASPEQQKKAHRLIKGKIYDAITTSAIKKH